MKLMDILPFTLGLGTFVIGIHQSMVHGITESYWIFMLSLGLLFLYSYRKGKNNLEQDDLKQKTTTKTPPNKKKKAKRKKR